MKRMVRCAWTAMALLATAGVQAQEGFPGKSITMMVPNAPGGGMDIVARIVAKRLSGTLGRPVAISYVAEAGGNTAHEMLAKATPDGHSILLSPVGALAVRPHIFSNLPYNPLQDFAPLTMAVAFANVLVIHPSIPAKTLRDFVKIAAANPGMVTFGSSGIASAGHLAGELLGIMANAKMIHTLPKGGGRSITGVVGGEIMSSIGVPEVVAPHVRAGRVRALATTGLTRSPSMQDIPTVAESGYPGYEALNWYAYIAPAKTPRDTVQRWTKELGTVLSDAGIKGELLSNGMESVPGTGEALQEYIGRDYAKWGKVLIAAGITKQ